MNDLFSEVPNTAEAKNERRKPTEGFFKRMRRAFSKTQNAVDVSKDKTVGINIPTEIITSMREDLRVIRGNTISRDRPFSSDEIRIVTKPDHYRFQSSGVSVFVDYYIDTEMRSQIRDGTLAGNIDFLPFKTVKSKPELVTATLGSAVVGFYDFFEWIQNTKDKNGKEIKPPQVLYGKTNLVMARFAEQFGFTILGDFKSKNNETNEEKQLREYKKYWIYGNFQKIKETILKAFNSNLLQALSSRLGKEAANIKPSSS